MEKTVKSVISDYSIQKLNEENARLHEVGTPRMFIDSIKATIDRYKNGEFKVKGMNKKYQVEDEEVISVYVAKAITYNFALPAKGEEVPTEILYMETKNGGYYYNYFTNQIGKTYEELNIKPESIEEFKSFVLTTETDEPSGYNQVFYTVKNSPILSIIIMGDSNQFNKLDSKIIEIKPITKSDAVKRGLNF